MLTIISAEDNSAQEICANFEFDLSTILLASAEGSRGASGLADASVPTSSYGRAMLQMSG